MRRHYEIKKKSHQIVSAPSQQEEEEVLASYHSMNYQLAEQQAKSLTQKHPHHPLGWKALGVVLKLCGRIEESLEPMYRSVQLNPNDAEAHCNLGSTLRVLGRLTEAEASYREAICLKPDVAEVHSNLGTALKDLDRLKEAEVSYREAIRLKKDYVEAHWNLGTTLMALRRLTEAEASYREAIRLKPDIAEVHSNLGTALKGLGRLTESEFSYREAIRLKKDYAEAHCNLGTTLMALGRLTEAEVSYREAIFLKPDFPVAHCSLGNALRDLGRLTEAEVSYREAIRLKPMFLEAHQDLLFALNYSESLSPELALIEAKYFGTMVSSMAIPKFSTWTTPLEQNKLRIGFVSGDLRNHPVGYFLEGLIQHIDPQRFDLYAFPTTSKTDDLTDCIKPRFKQWTPLVGKNDLESAKLIHGQGIHVLIDLSGHTAHNRLPVFSYKPAPCQISWLGYFATTGIPEMDYFLGDPTMSSKSEEHHFTENIWNLPRTWLCMTPPNQPVAVASLPALHNGYLTFGCFGNLSKTNDEVVKVWAKVLNQIPYSKLFLKSKQLSDVNVMTHIQGRFAIHGVTRDRLILEGPSTRAEYFQSYNRIDIVLDTFPYPGGTTSVDALWMGVPVLTTKGDRFLSHLGESIAMNAGRPDWIAWDADDYVKKAVAFGSDIQRLADLRTKLREQVLQTPLFKTKLFAKDFEDALWGIWNKRGGSHA